MARLTEQLELEDSSIAHLGRWSSKEELSPLHCKNLHVGPIVNAQNSQPSKTLDLKAPSKNEASSDWILSSEPAKQKPPAKPEDSTSKHSTNIVAPRPVVTKIMSAKRKKALEAVWRTVKGLSHSRM